MTYERSKLMIIVKHAMLKGFQRIMIMKLCKVHNQCAKVCKMLLDSTTDEL